MREVQPIRKAHLTESVTPLSIKRMLRHLGNRALLYRRSCAHFASTPRAQKNVYVLPMFPYPSGNIHMGHVRVLLCFSDLTRRFSLSDCITRYMAMQGCIVEREKAN